MKLTLAKILSILVVSGNGQKCNSVVSALREFSFIKDEETQKTNGFIIRYGKEEYNRSYYRIGEELFYVLTSQMDGIESRFFDPEISKITNN